MVGVSRPLSSTLKTFFRVESRRAPPWIRRHGRHQTPNLRRAQASKRIAAVAKAAARRRYVIDEKDPQTSEVAARNAPSRRDPCDAPARSILSGAGSTPALPEGSNEWDPEFGGDDPGDLAGMIDAPSQAPEQRHRDRAGGVRRPPDPTRFPRPGREVLPKFLRREDVPPVLAVEHQASKST